MKEYDEEVFYPNSTLIENAVIHYFLKHNFIAKKIREKDYLGQKVPDLEIETENGGLLYAEIKAPQLKLDKFLKAYKHSTTFSKINEFVSEAAKQFLTFNKLNIVPNFLVWVSFNFQLNHTNFIEAFNGYIALPDGRIMSDFRNEKYRKRVESAWKIIDAHIWLQASYQNGNIEFYEKKYFLRKDDNPIARNYIKMLETNE
jgi:hypothetical protein